LRIDIDGDPHAAAPEPCHIEQRAESLGEPWGFDQGNYCFFALSFCSAWAQPTLISFLEF
jgi:hypothetical protein